MISLNKDQIISTLDNAQYKLLVRFIIENYRLVVIFPLLLINLYINKKNASFISLIILTLIYMIYLLTEILNVFSIRRFQAKKYRFQVNIIFLTCILFLSNIVIIIIILFLFLSGFVSSIYTKKKPRDIIISEISFAIVIGVLSKLLYLDRHVFYLTNLVISIPLIWVVSISSRVFFDLIEESYINFSTIRQLLDYNDEASVFILSEEKKILFANVTALLRYHKLYNNLEDQGRKELRGLYCYKVFYNKKKSCLKCPVDNALRKNVTRTSNIYSSENGSTKDVNKVIALPFFLGKSNRRGILALHYELTDIVKKSEQKYKNIIEDSLNGIYIIKKENEGYYFKFANSAFCKMFGYTKKEIIDLPMMKLVSPSDYDLIEDKKKLREKVPSLSHSYEFKAVSKEGKEMDVIVNSTPIEFEGENAILGYIWDLTELQKLKVALASRTSTLISAGRIETLSTMAEYISHSLGAPITQIKDTVTNIKKLDDKKMLDFPLLHEMNKNIEKNSDLLLTACKKIQNITYRKERTDEKLNLMEVVDQVASYLNFRFSVNEISFEIKCNIGKRFIQADRVHIILILMCILNNSCEAIKEKFGEDIKGRTYNGKKIIIEINESGNFLEINIGDSGIGIKKELIERVVETTYTSKGGRGGYGLGLPATLSIMQMYGGNLAIKSEYGLGTNVILRLPKSK